MPITVYRGGQVQQITRATIGLYCVGGRGKTTTALSADNPVLLDFEGTSYRAVNPLNKPVIDMGSATWQEIASYNDPDRLIANADTVILDTVTALVRIAIAGIIGDGAPKLRQKDGSPTMQGWMALGDQLFSYYERFTRSGKNVVFLFQPNESVENDESFVGLAAVGKSKDFVLANADMIGEIVKNEDGTNSIDYTMHTKHIGKDPLQWGKVEIPHINQNPNYLGDEINRYIAGINERKQSESAPVADEFQQAAMRSGERADARRVTETPVVPQQPAPGVEVLEQLQEDVQPQPPETPSLVYFPAGDTRSVEEILYETVASLPTLDGVAKFNEALEELRTIGRADNLRTAMNVAASLGYTYDKPNRVYVAKG